MKLHIYFLPVLVAIIKCVVTNRNNFIYSKEVDKSGTQSINYVQGSQKGHPSYSLCCLWKNGSIEATRFAVMVTIVL